MNLSLPNVTLLGLTQNYNFFEAGLNFSNTKTVSIQGLVTDLTASSGISGLWNQSQGVNELLNLSNYESIILNGYNFGQGKLLSLNLEQSNDVKLKSYSAQIQILETGDLFNMDGEIYGAINKTNFQYLNNFSENYDFNKKANGGYSYTHNASIQFSSGVNQNVNAINQAKTLAQSLFNNSFGFGYAFYSGFTSKAGKRFFTESYNLINNTCNFNETFDFDTNQGNYSIVKTNSIEIDQNGIVTATENGDIKGIEVNTYENAISALNIEILSAYNNCSQLYSYYIVTDSLSNVPISTNKKIDIFNNNISYNIIFSNRPNLFSNYIWDYTQNISYENLIARVSENGTIVGRGEDKKTAFTNAKNAFATIRNAVSTRAASFYTSNGYSSSNIFIENETREYSPYRMEVSYGVNFSNEEVLVGINGIKRIIIQENNSKPVYFYGKIGVIGRGEEIQDQYNNTLGSKSVVINMFGEPGVPLSEFLTQGISIINGRKPSGSEVVDIYITNLSFERDENNSIVNFQVSWNFFISSEGKTISI